MHIFKNVPGAIKALKLTNDIIQNCMTSLTCFITIIQFATGKLPLCRYFCILLTCLFVSQWNIVFIAKKNVLRSCCKSVVHTADLQKSLEYMFAVYFVT